MFKHLRVIFLHFMLKNRNGLSENELYSWAVWPIFYNKKKKKKKTDRNFKFISIFLKIICYLLWFLDQRVYLHTCSFQPTLNVSFFWGGGRIFILPCQDEYLKTCRKFTLGTSRHRTSTWSYKCSPRGAGKARFNVATPTYATVTCTAYVLLYNLQTKSI